MSVCGISNTLSLRQIISTFIIYIVNILLTMKPRGTRFKKETHVLLGDTGGMINDYTSTLHSANTNSS